MFGIDFFCGAGGLTSGFANAGIRVLAGVDVNAACARTYQRNNRSSAFVCADVRSSPREIARHVASVAADDLIFAGCAPCQPFSKQRREVDTTGNTLLIDFGRQVSEFRPAFVVIENVPGIARIPGNSTYRRFLRCLRELGYYFDHGSLDAKRFGVPQTRTRWVLIASRTVVPTLPEPTHGPGLLPYGTVREAIAHLPPLEAGEESVALPNHRAARLSEINLRRLRATPTDGGGRFDWPLEFRLDCHRDRDGHSDVYGRMRWDAPAPTLTCRCYSISNGRYGHPEQDRGISLREAASLQSFPERYAFYGGSQAEIGSQIGNAVPVRMAEALARHVLGLAAMARRGRALRPRSNPRGPRA